MPTQQNQPHAQNQQQSSAFGNWDLRRDNISRPTEGELDSKLSMSTFSENDDMDDELETPPFFKNR
ncbi:cell division protein FtsZ, partial [Streptococcus agalactiae]